MKIYPYTVSDVSPDANRSTYNPDIAYIGRVPCRGNSGNYPEITSGWCGTSNDAHKMALGEIDTDDADWFERLTAAFDETAAVLDRDDILGWLSSPEPEEPDDYDDYGTTWNSYCCPLDTRQQSEAFAWEELSDDSYPTVKSGWTVMAGYDQSDDIECLARDECDALEEDTETSDGPAAVAAVLDLAGIRYCHEEHETYSSASHGIDWAYLAVRDEDVARAESAIRARAALTVTDDPVLC